MSTTGKKRNRHGGRRANRGTRPHGGIYGFKMSGRRLVEVRIWTRPWKPKGQRWAQMRRIRELLRRHDEDGVSLVEAMESMSDVGGPE